MVTEGEDHHVTSIYIDLEVYTTASARYTSTIGDGDGGKDQRMRIQHLKLLPGPKVSERLVMNVAKTKVGQQVLFFLFFHS